MRLSVFAIAGIVLLVMVGTLLVAGLLILVALVGVAVGIGSTFAMSHRVEMQSITSTLALILGLAVGVLADVFVVRMTLVPALMRLLGEKAWWIPCWLDRLLPNVDVEGAKLQHN